MEENNPQPNTQQGLKTLRTYSSDMADAIRENEATVIKIALAEQKRHEREDIYRKAEGSPVSKFLLVLGSIVLVLIAGGAVYFFMQKKDVANVPVVAPKKIETFIAYDDEVFIDTTKVETKTDIAEILKTESEKKGTPGSIKALFLTTSQNGTPAILPLSKLLSLMDVSAPGSLTRSLDEYYMVGTYTSLADEEKPHLFFIFQTTDFNQSFAGMLAWEKTILDDLYLEYGVDVSGERSALFEKEFKDIIINNKDARILYDNAGKDILYYIFLDKNTFVITDSQEAIKEINTRIIIKKTKPL
jgi:hypothetical protein